jgi:hypothetical protein
MALTKLNSASMPTGTIIQTINQQVDSEAQKSSTSWEDTGLFSMTFPNALQSNSKVLATIYATLGEVFSNNWGSATYLTIYENSSNVGSDAYGIVNGNAQMTGDSNYTQYECNRLVGQLLFTPSVTNGTYKLYVKSGLSYTKVIGGIANTASTSPQGTTQLTLQEIAG